MPRMSIEEVHRAVAGTNAPQQFLGLVSEHPDLAVLHSQKGATPGSWNAWTLRDYADITARAAAGLQQAGLKDGQRMLLMMRNRPDFHWFDAAAQFLRATPVSIYNSSSPEEIAYLAGDAQAAVAIVEDLGFAERIRKVRAELPNLQHLFVIESPGDGLPDGLRHANELLGCGSVDLAELAELTEPADLATLIYTSGTTGPPKGVMLDQHNVVYTAEQLKRCFGLAEEELAG